MTRHIEDVASSMGSDAAVRQVDAVTGALESLSDVFDQEEQLEAVLQRVCQQAVHAIDEAGFASVTLLRDGEPYTCATAGDGAIALDEAQYAVGEGPCLDAAKTGQVVRATTTTGALRWPVFAAKTAGDVVGSYLSAPLVIDSKHHGSLNLYGYGAEGFDALEAALLELYTTAAEAALRNAHRYLQAREKTTQLSEALTTRAVIDQAKGILMAVHRIPAEDAFAMLIEQSQQQNAKLRDLAEHFVTDIVNGDA